MVLKQLAQVEKKITQLLEIKAFLQSIAIKEAHSETDCKAMAGLEGKLDF